MALRSLLCTDARGSMLYAFAVMHEPITQHAPDVLATLTSPEVRVPPGWMIGASTRLLDSWTPMLEVIRVPAIRYERGAVTVSLNRNSEVFEDCSVGGGRRALNTFTARMKRTVRHHGLILDLRFDSCANLAHACIQTGPIALAARAVAQEKLGRDDLVLIVRGDTPDHYATVLELLGFRCVRSMNRFIGDVLRVEVRGVAALESLARQWIPTHVAAALHERQPGLGPRIFISRRGSRFIRNESEISSLLGKRGFRTVYLEDHPPMQQLAALCQAERIVAVHGAALGPLLLRSSPGTAPQLKLVEVFGPGYVAQMGRLMSVLVGFDWIGVRGRIMPEVVRDLDVRIKPRSHQASSFFLDPRSLEIALDTIETCNGEPSYQVVM
jgi:hypothetical protein